MATEQVSDLLDEVALYCREAPTTIMVQAYISATRRFCSRSRWLLTTITGATEAGTRLYNLGDDPYHEVLGIKAIVATLPDQEENPPLTESFSGNWDPSDPDGPPELYQYVPEAQFALHPLPDAVYDLTVTCPLQPKRGANAIDATLLVKWQDALEDGALARLLALPSVPWSNPREAAERERKFNAAIASAGLSAARGYNAGAAPTARLGGGNAHRRTSQQVI